MEWAALTLGALGTNCYLIHTDAGTLVLDPADDAPTILLELQKRGWTADAVALTHAHFDHMLALNGLGAQEVFLHGADVPALTDARRNLSALFGAPFQGQPRPVELAEGAALFGLSVLHTPGHTLGSLCLYAPEDELLFSGDTMFAGGWGRTDFPGGDEAALCDSLFRLTQLPEGTRVLPGHGGSTTIARERRGGRP